MSNLSNVIIVFMLSVVYKSCSKLYDVPAVQIWWHLAPWFRIYACLRSVQLQFTLCLPRIDSGNV
jgi:hypothetical protein